MKTTPVYTSLGAVEKHLGRQNPWAEAGGSSERRSPQSEEGRPGALGFFFPLGDMSFFVFVFNSFFSFSHINMFCLFFNSLFFPRE